MILVEFMMKGANTRGAAITQPLMRDCAVNALRAAPDLGKASRLLSLASHLKGRNPVVSCDVAKRLPGGEGQARLVPAARAKR